MLHSVICSDPGALFKYYLAHHIGWILLANQWIRCLWRIKLKEKIGPLQSTMSLLLKQAKKTDIPGFGFADLPVECLVA